MLRLLLPLMCGIVAGRHVPETVLPAVAVIAAASLLLLMVNELPAWRGGILCAGWVYEGVVFVLFAAAGCGLCLWQVERVSPDFVSQKGVYRVVLQADADPKERSVLCDAEIVSRMDSAVSIRPGCRACLYLPADSAAASLRRGDVLAVLGSFEPLRNTGNPCGFDRKSYLQGKGIGATLYAPAGCWVKIGHDSAWSARGAAADFRRRLLDVYRRYGISGDEFGVLAAMTLGYRDELSPDLRRSYIGSGAMHVLAVSGLHVGILFSLISCLLFWLKRFRWGRAAMYGVQMAALWAYAMLVGLPNSVLRAALMLTFLATAAVLRRESHLFNNIAGAAFVLLVASPLSLFDVGFQLSFSAVSGIVFFTPYLLSLFPQPRWRVARWAVGLPVATVAAQIGVLPFLLCHFHQFSAYFILSGLLVIPAAYVVLILAVVLLCVSGWGVIASPVAVALKLVLRTLNGGVRLIDGLPHAVVPAWTDTMQTAVLAVFVLMLVWAVSSGSRRVWLAAVLCVPLFFGLRTLAAVRVLHTDSVVAYADRRADVIQFRSGRAQWLLTNDSVVARAMVADVQERDGLAEPVVCPVDPNRGLRSLRFGPESYVLLSGEAMGRRVLATRMNVDCLIVGKVRRMRPQDVIRSFRPSRMVLLDSAPRYLCDSLSSYCGREGIPCHETRRQGACKSVSRSR